MHGDGPTAWSTTGPIATKDLGLATLALHVARMAYNLQGPCFVCAVKNYSGAVRSVIVGSTSSTERTVPTRNTE